MRTAVGYVGAAAPVSTTSCGTIAFSRNQQLAGRRVLLEEDPTYKLDERGRRLYYAYTPDGESIDATLVREGLASAVRTDGSHGPALAALEAIARVAKQGCLWGGL